MPHTPPRTWLRHRASGNPEGLNSGPRIDLRTCAARFPGRRGASHRSPKRKRGSRADPSLTLRVSMRTTRLGVGRQEILPHTLRTGRSRVILVAWEAGERSPHSGTSTTKDPTNDLANDYLLLFLAGAVRLYAAEEHSVQHAPVVIWTSSPVQPGETVLVHGGNFGTNPVVDLTSGEQKQTVTPISVSETAIMFVYPESWPAGIVSGVVRSGELASKPFQLNAPDVWWVHGDRGREASTQAGSVSLFGNCLADPGKAGPRGQFASASTAANTARLFPLDVVKCNRFSVRTANWARASRGLVRSCSGSRRQRPGGLRREDQDFRKEEQGSERGVQRRRLRGDSQRRHRRYARNPGRRGEAEENGGGDTVVSPAADSR